MNPSSIPFDTGLTAADLDPQHPPVVETPWGPFAIYSDAQRVFAVEAFCPHMLGPLFAGSIVGSLVTCPWHAWRYDVSTGARIDEGCPTSGPEARPLKRLVVDVDERGVLVLGSPAERGGFGASG